MSGLRHARSSPASSSGPAIGDVGNPRSCVVVDIRDPGRRERVAKALIEVDLVVVLHDPDSPDETVMNDARPDLVVSDDIQGDGSMGDRLRTLLGVQAVPVIAIADDDTAGVASFERGAADFVVDPFAKRELQARALARLRRAPVAAGSELRLDRSSRRVSVRGVEVELSPREYDLLEFLVERPRTVLTRDHILAVVWGSKPEWQDRDTVTEHVYRLRRKIERDPRNPELIITVRGVGYRFEGQQPS